MISLKKCTCFCVVALLMLSMTGCQKSGEDEIPPAAPYGEDAEESSAVSPDSGSSSKVIPLDDSVNWETKEYNDSYLTYQIPATWEENPDYSNAADRLTFFISSDAVTETPSNVNIQINSTTNQSKYIDYGDTEVQRDFHEFLISEVGLTEEAKNSTLTVYQTPEFYVYAISFSRVANDGTMVRQTAYVPVGLDYSMMIWATDWNDGVVPSADEIAMHLCATLKIKDTPAQ